jgi:hypothetical protein
MAQFLDHLANDSMPSLVDRLFVRNMARNQAINRLN